MKTSGHLEFKKQGVWTKHYTMSLWPDEQSMQEFVRSGAHLEAMKQSKAIAKEIRTITYEADALPDWKTAKGLLEKAKVLKF